MLKSEKDNYYHGGVIVDLIVEHAETYAAKIKDAPGALANKLTALAEAGADLELIISRRAPDEPGAGVVFVTPLRGDQEIQAATVSGFSVSNGMHSVRIEGENKPGIAAELAGKIGESGINLRGFSAAVIGTKFVVYLALDTPEDAHKIKGLIE
jgi:ACT domain-containing protein